MFTGEGATLYVDEAKITQEVKAHLEAARVSVKPYEQGIVEAIVCGSWTPNLATLCFTTDNISVAALDDVSSLGTSGKKVLADPKKVSFAVARAAGYSEKQVSKKIKVRDYQRISQFS